MSESNGEVLPPPHLLLEFDPATHGVIIKGNVANLDMALAILAQASREIETQWRITRAIEAQTAAKQQTEQQKRVADLLNTTMRRH
jgi:hypothetical protein